MKKTSNNLCIAVFLALISQGIKAQFDDVYYDPDRDKYRQTNETSFPKETTNKEQNGLKEVDPYDTSSDNDDEYDEWEDQDYYYTSKLKRFHRPFRGFDYYDPCYVDYYYYDPFDYNPWYPEYDIYISNWGYHNYNRWNHWHHRSWNYNPYWSRWDWAFGWSSCPVSYSYNYWPNSYYYGYYNYGSYGRNYNHYSNNHHWNNGNQGHYDNHPNGRYFGSRGFGTTNTSKHGPVRVVKPTPKTFKELPGTNPKQNPDRGTKRVIRSSDGDRYNPDPPKPNPKRANPRNENEKVQPRTPEKGSGRNDKFIPRESSGVNNNSEEQRPSSGKTGRKGTISILENNESSPSAFKPKREQREEVPPVRKPNFDMPRETKQEQNKSSGFQRNESRSESFRKSESVNSGTKSNNGRSENSNSGGRKSPR